MSYMPTEGHLYALNTHENTEHIFRLLKLNKTAWCDVSYIETRIHTDDYYTTHSDDTCISKIKKARYNDSSVYLPLSEKRMNAIKTKEHCLSFTIPRKNEKCCMDCNNGRILPGPRCFCMCVSIKEGRPFPDMNRMCEIVDEINDNTYLRWGSKQYLCEVLRRLDVSYEDLKFTL